MIFFDALSSFAICTTTRHRVRSRAKHARHSPWPFWLILVRRFDGSHQSRRSFGRLFSWLADEPRGQRGVSLDLRFDFYRQNRSLGTGQSAFCDHWGLRSRRSPLFHFQRHGADRRVDILLFDEQYAALRHADRGIIPSRATQRDYFLGTFTIVSGIISLSWRGTAEDLAHAGSSVSYRGGLPIRGARQSRSHRRCPYSCADSGASIAAPPRS